MFSPAAASSSAGEAKSVGVADYQGTIKICLPRDPALLEQFEEKVDPSCLCPITRSVFIQPVITSDGETYEYSAIKRHIETHLAQGKQATSPLTNAPLAHINLTPNNDKARQISTLLDDFLKEKKQRKAEDSDSDAADLTVTGELCSIS